MTEAASSITFDIVRVPQTRSTSLPRWITVEADRASDGGLPSGDGGKSWAVCVGRPAPHLEIKVVTSSNPPADSRDDGPGSSRTSERLSGSLQSETESRSGGYPEVPNSQSGSVLRTQRTKGVPLSSFRNGLSSETGGPAGTRFDPPFREGVIQVRGPNVFLGYWNQPEETAKVLSEDGWFSTGDVGYVDDRGRLWLCGREKDMVKTGGENVHAVEVRTPAEAPCLLSFYPLFFHRRSPSFVPFSIAFPATKRRAVICACDYIPGWHSGVVEATSLK